MILDFNKLVGNWPKIIETVRTPLGLAALVVMVVAALAYLLSAEASEGLRAVMFVVAVGAFILLVAMAIWAANRPIPSPRPPAPSELPAPPTVSRLTDNYAVVVRDVWLLDAVGRAFLGRWQRVEIDFDGPGLGQAEFDRLGDLVHKETRQLAYEGELPIWGKRHPGDIWREVPTSHWEHHRLDWFAFLKGDPEGLQTTPVSDHSPDQGDRWLALMTSRVKVEELWPLSRQQRACRIGEIYAEAVKLRNKAATLRVLDAASENKMNMLQSTLLEELRELAPERSINLQTLNQYDPRQHPAMALQDPRRTLEFSEFLRRVMRILDDYK